MDDAQSLGAEAGPSGTTSWPSPPTYDFDASPVTAATVDASKLESDIRGSFLRSAQW